MVVALVMLLDHHALRSPAWVARTDVTFVIALVMAMVGLIRVGVWPEAFVRATR
jgi:hypothetical protein